MKLAARHVEKVWGRRELPAPFARHCEEPVGEIWFEPPAQLDELLVKYLFTSEKLSVQVHPSDAEAGRAAKGKEECWLVLDAEPDATLAIGFRESVSAEAMRAAALDGSIEQLLEWHRAKAGDFFYLPAGTVHAIGPGLTLVEIQQNSDITYRLFDYGRPRELHLDRAIAAASGAPHSPRLRSHWRKDKPGCLVDGAHFRVDQCLGAPDAATSEAYAGPLLVLPLETSVTIGEEAIAPGECGYAPSIDAVRFGEGRSLIARPRRG